MDRCCRVFSFFLKKNRYCGLFPSFHRPGFVVYFILNRFPSCQPMMKNCFRNCNLNIIYDVFCNGHIFSTFLIQRPFFSESQMFFWLHKHRFWHSFFLCHFVFCINYFVEKFLCIRLNVQPFFFFLFRCFGITRNFSIMFLPFSSSECGLYLSYDLFCDEPASFYVSFLMQFSSSELSISSGLFLSKVNPCYNLLKCCSHSAIAISDSLCICANWEINCVNKYQKLSFIGLSLYLIISSNCSTFCIGNLYVVRNLFAIAFLYASI